MEHFAGMDVSVKDTGIRIVDDTGRIVREEPLLIVRRTLREQIGNLHRRLPAIVRNDDGTMDEVSSYVRLDLLSAKRQGRPKDCSASSSKPILEGPWRRFRREARARERYRHRRKWLA
jgi:hypothetical protein